MQVFLDTARESHYDGKGNLLTQQCLWPTPPDTAKKEVVTALSTREILAAAWKLMEQRGLAAVKEAAPV